MTRTSPIAFCRRSATTSTSAPYHGSSSAANVTREAVHGSGGTVSAPVLRRHGPRVPRAGGPRARPPLRPGPAAGTGFKAAQARSHPVALLRHAAEHEATNAHRLLALGVPTTDVRHARGAEIVQRGGGGAVGAPMRGRGRLAMEAPGSETPKRRGDGAPAAPHRRLRSRAWLRR